MPLKKGSSKADIQSNFDEFKHGKEYAKIQKKYGTRKANQVMTAAVLSTADKSKPGKSIDRKSKKKKGK